MGWWRNDSENPSFACEICVDINGLHCNPFFVTLTFIETPVFSRQLAECVDDEEFRAFQNDLLRNPEQGDLLVGCRGLRKTRMALLPEGKAEARASSTCISRTIMFFTSSCSSKNRTPQTSAKPSAGNSAPSPNKSNPPMHKKNKIPDFSFDELLTSMRQGADHAAGKITARTHQLTASAEVISASEIAAIRERMNVSQAVFADLLNVPKATAVSWERGLRSPSGAAVRLLQIAKNRPQALLETAAHP